MNSDLEVAKVLKPRGLKGELKVEFFTSNVSRLLHLKSVKIGGVEYAVESISADGTFGYIKLVGVDTVEDAEKYRDKSIFADRNSLPSLPEGTHYIVDLIGLDVICAGEKIGVICDVLQYGSADIYVCKTKDGTVSFPALKQAIKSVDIVSGKLVVDEGMFSRIAVYN